MKKEENTGLKEPLVKNDQPTIEYQLPTPYDVRMSTYCAPHHKSTSSKYLVTIPYHTLVCAQREGESGSAAKALTCTKFFTPWAFAALASMPATSTFTFSSKDGRRQKGKETREMEKTGGRRE